MQKLILRAGGGAAAVLLATGVLGAQAPGASAGPQAATRTDSSKVVAGAATALRQHSTELRLTKGQSFRATDTVLDRSGATHVRMARTYRGLPVLGGDLVVHRAADGSWAGASRTLTAPLRMSTTPRLTEGVASARATRPSKATRGIRGFRAKGTPRLVVDAIGHRPRLAWAVTTGGRHADGTPSRMTSYVDARTGAVLRREERIETVDGSGQSLYSGTVPLKLTQSGSTYSAQGPDPRQHLHDRPQQQDRLDLLPAVRRRLPGRDHVHQHLDDVRQRHDEQPRLGRCGRAVRHQPDLGLLQPGPRPERHLRQRHRLLQPHPLRLELRQRLLGRHQDDVWRR